jgi:hypothetical protein
MICSSCADTPWINPSLSGTASAEVKDVGDMVEGRREGAKRDAASFDGGVVGRGWPGREGTSDVGGRRWT